MNKKSIEEYQERETRRWKHIWNLRQLAKTHPNYNDYVITVDSLHDSSSYESGTIISISPTREGFDELYEEYNVYRGGFREIKCGDDYIIYGFDFD